MRQYPRTVALPLFAVAVAGVWGLLYLHHSHRNDPLDTEIALLIGAGWTLGLLFMLTETEGWTIRALGVLGAIAGDAVLYSYIAAGHWDGAYLTAGQLEGLLDLARSFLLVGMPLFIIGVALTIAAQWRARRTPDPADEPRATRDAPTGLP